MAKIQQAINQAIGTVGAIASISKGLGAVSEDKDVSQAKQKIEIGKTSEKIAKLQSDISQGVSARKETRQKIAQEKEGFTLIDGVKVRTSFLGEEAVKEQNELIKKYKQANKESLKISRAKKVQLEGYKMMLASLQGGKQ